MTIADEGRAPSAGVSGPVRFDKDPHWAKKTVRPIALLVRGGVKVTEHDRERVRRAVLGADVKGAAIAAAILDEKSLSMSTVTRAIAGGLGAIEDPHPALVDLLTELETPPSWFDPERARRGAEVVLRTGAAGMHVLGTGSLMTGYTTAATTRQLVATGRLVEDCDIRIAETTRWWFETILPGGIARDGEGWRQTVNVRIIHALVNHRLLGREDWELGDWGMPINQADQAGTLGLFSTTFLIGVRLLGVPVSAAEGRDVMHLWRYVGWLMGVDPDWLPDDEQTGRRNMVTIGMFSPGPDEDSKVLGRALYAMWGRERFTWISARRAKAHQAYMLSLERIFAGKQGLADLGLPAAAPWALPLAWASNFPMHAAARVSPALRRRVENHGRRYISGWLANNEAIGDIPKPTHRSVPAGVTG